MELSELQVIWNTQHTEPMFAVNQDSLHRTISKGKKELGRHLAFMEFFLLAITLVTGIATLVDTILEGNTHYQYMMAGIYLTIASALILKTISRRKNVRQFDASLSGELEESIYHTDVMIKRLREFLWWYVIPFIGAQGISMYFNPKPELLPWAMFVPVMLISTHVSNLRTVRNVYQPKKAELESLREKLQEVG